MGKFAAFDAPGADAIVAEAIRGIGAEIAALKLRNLRGVVLGGGYGRGEGGVMPDGRLSNDLDFYVVVADGTSAAEAAAEVAAPLEEISHRWTEKLGVDVDFCQPKTPWRMCHDQERLMIQELINGYHDVTGEPGERLFEGIRRLEASELPWMEAVRLLANRGAGLLLAAESSEAGFIARNINKAVLGAGDARLIASHRYAWRAEDRAAALGDRLYSRALDWKFRPQAAAPCTIDEARACWLAAARDIMAAPEARGPQARRSPFHAARWIARRHTIGPLPLATFAFDPTLRVFLAIRCALETGSPFSASLKRDWQIFN